MKNKSLEYEKSEQQMFEILIWVKKSHEYFFWKMCGCFKGGDFYSGYNKKKHKKFLRDGYSQIWNKSLKHEKKVTN